MNADTTSLVVLGLLFGGVGLFFIGASFLSTGLKTMAGPGMRRSLASMTHRTPGQILAGIVSGAIAQSSSVASFIMAGMVAFRMTTLRAAAPVVLWANVGTCALVFLATIDTQEVSHWAFGLVGLGYYLHLQKREQYRGPMMLIFGLALIFIGIEQTKAAAEAASAMPWFKAFLDLALGFEPLLFLFAVALAYVARSSATVSVVAIAFAHAGLLNQFDAVVMLLGANVGSGLVSFDLSRDMQGDPKYLMLIQALSKMIGSALTVPWLLPDVIFDWNLIAKALDWMNPNLVFQLSVAFLLLQLLGAIVTHVFVGPLLALLKARWPRGQVAEWSDPQYVRVSGDEAEAIAPALAGLEVMRVSERNLWYLQRMTGDETHASLDAVGLHAANLELLARVEQFLVEAEQAGGSTEVLSQLTHARMGVESMLGIEKESYALLTDFESATQRQQLGEESRALVLGLVRRQLELIAQEQAFVRGEMSTDEARARLHYDPLEEVSRLDQQRDSYLDAHPELAPAERQVLLKLLGHLTKIHWLSSAIVRITDEFRQAIGESIGLNPRSGGPLAE